MEDYEQEYIASIVNESARLEQLAEEASELSHAALKLARILRHENPTAAKEEKSRKRLVEEYSDVVNMANSLDMTPDAQYMDYKTNRWIHRLFNFN